MTSVRDRILKAKNEKEIDRLVEESETYVYVSTNTKTKIKKAANERLFGLSGNISKKSKKKGNKNENAAFRRK